MRRLLRWPLLAVTALQIASASAAAPSWTTKHEAGRCAVRGHCGKQGFFGSDLPCPDNGLAGDPTSAAREKLVELCGEKWADGPVCCLEEQIDVLATNLKRADQVISACPACEANFFNLFCTFTCSPDQSLFLNVTDVAPKSDKYLVTELDNLVSSGYGGGFYDSCKDVKFGAGMKAMDLIGGGAKDFSHFLNFLGEKKFGGSPFQMNFPNPDEKEFPGMTTMDDKPKQCNDEDERYRCACVDCPATCPKLPEVSGAHYCHVGVLPCLSFAVIIVYSVLILLLILAISGHVAYQKHSKAKNERLQLLQDTAPSDDEDEGDVLHSAGMVDRPQREYYLNNVCDRLFNRLGYLCAEFPAVTILSSVLVVALLSLGWINFAIETNPVRLWVSPDSAAAKEKQFFDTNFGPFYRAEQAFLVNDTSPFGPGPVLSYDTLGWWFDVENRVQRLISLDAGAMFDDVCFKPVEDACIVQSVTGYFGGSFANVDPIRWESQLEKCAESPVDCLPQFQQPLDPKMVFGGYNKSVADAKSLIITWVVNNHPEGSSKLTDTMDWEKSLKNLLLAVQAEARDRGLRLSFNTEISLEEELNKSTNTDAKIVVISYIIMFLYASLALGSTTLAARTILRYPADALVQSKFMLGIVGIVIVLMSVSASVGLFSACGVKVTLIIAEVIPFLVLAIGVDNIFLIVHEFERVNVNYGDAPIPERIGRAMGRIGPSILLSASTETVAFALGAAVDMPAVRNFAAYAAGAVLLNALLQITLFVAVLALNQQRVEAGRADCFPCLKVRGSDSSVGNNHAAYGVDEEGGLERFIRKHYAPALLGKKTKVGIITFFLGIFTVGLALIPKVELGLDQRIAIPSDSYLIPYFNDFYAYFDVGPPVYFVAQDLNVTERRHQQELCGHFTTCQSFSLSNILEQESKRPDVSHIASSAAVWVDDYLQWLDPSFESCCVDGRDTCFAHRDPPWNRTLWGMPEGQEFVHYLNRWLEAPTTADCPLAGKAAYGSAIVIDHERLTIPASHFRTSHTPLKSQSDFIDAYSSARRIASEISEHTGTTVFPYSAFYIFFDQYLSIVRLSCALLGSALAIILVLTTIFLGSLQTGLVVTVTVAMILIDIVGFMAIAGVSLNAVSLVNLVISVGIGVEFCAHIARAFAFPSVTVMERAPRHKFRGKDVRAWSALVNVGASVFTGITVTKFVGVCVLAFTRSKIFEVYYFRIWVALVVFAATHALVFLPVVLSLFGGEGYVDPESDGGLERDLRSRTYPALMHDDGYDSDEL
ncbi:multidrug efflux transporter AcrB transmembrane domain-containing protein [Eremomyces bilateralis CBS 781.70]|uniref:Multidrug efflux transporter AcrB transmembrane domain-containing protein n=1 Tax=Eremomyces bilateralis CBS 781.70 TaxID=1392243 RepID=A0A6G1G635_9PEZI|nr:multidrug efflux transporter AcrB transmembrane domain-containing protein [Eremomyces bilateralis CBS 781.70]KAF1813411.1 multidrug efflux transporter AcrB transmembrane domain-containing protein [Eremomyces bilateralis CBS 781.70]